MVLDFLAVDNFDFTRKIVKKILGEKLVKIELLNKNLTFGIVCKEIFFAAKRNELLSKSYEQTFLSAQEVCSCKRHRFAAASRDCIHQVVFQKASAPFQS